MGHECRRTRGRVSSNYAHSQRNPQEMALGAYQRKSPFHQVSELIDHYRVRYAMGGPVSSGVAPERQQVPEDLFTLLNGMLHQVSIKKTVAVAERWSPVRNINVPHTASSSVNGFIVRGFKTIYDSHELHILLCNVPASKCMYWRSWWTQNEWIIFHEYSWREWVEGSPMPSCAPKSAACVPRRREYLRPQRVKWLK